MSSASNDLLTSLLRDVSRSFHLTMRILPGAIRPQISLAYLVARTTDTIADTDLVPVGDRLIALNELRTRILGETNRSLDFTRFVSTSAGDSPSHIAAESTLLRRVNEALSLLESMAADDRQRIREVLAVIVSGQELDLRRFTTSSSTTGSSPVVVALANGDELDDYTYRVAGCVGEFWTKMCRAHLFPRAPLDDAALLANGVRFGKGLQLVNVLRDLPADLRKGRCYLPADALAKAGLSPTNLLNPENESRMRPVYDAWLDRAEAHLAAGWNYTNTLPRGQARVRLACAWPILIGMETLAKLRAARVLDPSQRVKVSRAEVRRIILRSVIRLPFASAWRNQFPNSRHG